MISGLVPVRRRFGHNRSVITLRLMLKNSTAVLGRAKKRSICLPTFLAQIPYNALRKKEDYDEHYYRTLLLLLCRFVTPYTVWAEQANAVGRSDLLIETKDAVFCFEFMKKDAPEKAIQQIDDMGYLIPYEADHKKLYKIGVRFDFDLRTIGNWVIEEVAGD